MVDRNDKIFINTFIIILIFLPYLSSLALFVLVIRTGYFISRLQRLLAFVPFFLISDPASASQCPRASNLPPCTEEAMQGPAMVRWVGTTMAGGGCGRKTTTGPR